MQIVSRLHWVEGVRIVPAGGEGAYALTQKRPMMHATNKPILCYMVIFFERALSKGKLNISLKSTISRGHTKPFSFGTRRIGVVKLSSPCLTFFR